MAKPKLTQEMIEFIVCKYDSKTENNTFPEITDMLEAEYGIKITYQAVHQNYHKYKKENENMATEAVFSSKKQVESHQTETTKVRPKTSIKSMAERRKGVKPNLTNKDRGYDTSLEEEYDIDTLFSTQNPTE